MKNNFNNASDAAAFLADDQQAKMDVEQDITRSSLVSMLINLRVEKGITQTQVAAAMGCNPSKISKIESGTDLTLKWVDIVGYLDALGMSTSLVADDTKLPAASRIKQCVFRIHDLMESLVNLATEVGDDTDITDKIHQFYGEVLLNFLSRFEDSYAKLSSVLKVPEQEIHSLTEQKQKNTAKRQSRKPAPA